MFRNPAAGRKKEVTLRRMPSWLAPLPWIVVVCSLLLSMLVLLFDFQGTRRESEIATRIFLERGASLIHAFESTLRAGMGFRWTDEELQAVLDKLGTSSDIHYMAVTDEDGDVLAASDPRLSATSLFRPDELAGLDPREHAQGGIRQFAADGETPARPVFQVYQRLSVRQYAEFLRMRHGHMGSSRRLAPFRAEPRHFIIFVGYDLAPLLDAQAKDSRRAFIHWAILAFLGLVGVLTLFLIRNYQRSRQLVQETTAFSFALIDAMPLGIIALDTSGRITTFNPEAARITGLDPGMATGREMSEALPQLWSLSPSAGDPAPRAEREVYCAFGERRRVPLALSAVPVITEDGLPAGQTLLLRDLGEIRRLQAEIRRQDRLAALGNLAAGIAHEIRNPLGAIKGLARFFREFSPPGSEEARVATIMTQEVQRLDKVVGDLLELARPDQVHPAPLSLFQLFERVRGMIRTDMEARQVEFRLDLPDPCPEVSLDFDRMTQVLLNLFLNAVQAMPHGGVLSASARFDCRKDPDGGGVPADGPARDTLVLEIADTGEGIAPDKLQEIFSPYYTTKAHGTGLGLSLAHKVIEAHGGGMEVHSELGRGTRFTLYLPLPCPS